MMINKRRIYVVMLLCSIVLLSGCAQLRDKFVRKPKAKDDLSVMYQTVRTYDVKPNIDLYAKRYIFWKTWQRELIGVLRDDNHKKKLVASDQAVSNLYDMYGMLDDETGDKLMVYIEKMKEIDTSLKKGKVTAGTEIRLRKRLETIYRHIKNKFSYNDVGENIRYEFRK